MRTYSEIFAIGEFRTLFASTTLSVAGGSIAMLGLSTLVYADTGSPFLAATAFLAGFLPQAFGALVLGSLADRLPPRALLAGWSLVRAGALALIASGWLPVWAALALVMSVGFFDAVSNAGRLALAADLLPGDGYVLGRSVLNLAVGGMQIAGFGGAGLLLALVGPHAAMGAAAVLELVLALVYRLGIRARAARAGGRASMAGVRTLFADRHLVRLLVVQWVPNGLIVGAEALFVPFAGERAGVLFMAAAGGMLAGDLVIGRWTTPELRARIAMPLYALLGVPYLAFFLEPGPWLGAALVAVASFGYGGHLCSQEWYLAAVPEDMRGQALGLAGSGMLSCQALAAALTGAVAEFVPVHAVMGLAAVASLGVAAALVPGLSRTAVRPVSR